MSTTYQQPSTNLYTGELPDLNPEGGTFTEFVPPEDGWHEILFKLRYVEAPDGRQVPEIRHYLYQGKVDPTRYQIRFEFHLTDPDTEVTPWRQWVGWTIGENSTLRPILLAIRGDEPFPAGQQLNLDFLREHENRPFRAMITVDEVQARDNPERTLYFPKLVKCAPAGAAKTGRRTAKIGGKEASKPAPSGDAATQRQIDYIDKLARGLDLDRRTLEHEAQSVAGTKLADLTRAGASKLLDRLKEMQAADFEDLEASTATATDDEDDPFDEIPEDPR